MAGANQNQPFALLMLAEDVAAKLAEGGEALREDITASLQALLESVNAAVDPHERLAFMVVVKSQWTVENGFLTPTLKIKRNIVEATYEAQVEGWYAQRQPIIWEQ